MVDKEHDLFLSNIRELAKTKPGRDFIWHVLSLCNVYSDGFTADNVTFYNEGKRAIGISIIETLNDADPNLYPNLILRQNQEELSND